MYFQALRSIIGKRDILTANEGNPAFMIRNYIFVNFISCAIFDYVRLLLLTANFAHANTDGLRKVDIGNN